MTEEDSVMAQNDSVLAVDAVEESPLDVFHEECGVFGVYRHPEAANLAYLGLYAQQHRGQAHPSRPKLQPSRRQ